MLTDVLEKVLIDAVNKLNINFQKLFWIEILNNYILLTITFCNSFSNFSLLELAV